MNFPLSARVYALVDLGVLNCVSNLNNLSILSDVSCLAGILSQQVLSLGSLITRIEDYWKEHLWEIAGLALMGKH